MPRQRQRVKFDGIIIALMAILVLGGLIALGFLRDISSENQALVVMVVSLGLVGCFASLMCLIAFRKWLRKRIWGRAMIVWQESFQARDTPKFLMTDNISENELRQLAIRVYSRLGYRVLNRDGEDGCLQLINPDGKTELLACKQQPDSIKLQHVYSLELVMKRTKAVRGFFWAPAGFTEAAVDCVVRRSIVRMQKAHAFWNSERVMIW